VSRSLAARIESFELAYGMQMAAPEALDINKETSLVQKLYGLDNPKVCALRQTNVSWPGG